MKTGKINSMAAVMISLLVLSLSFMSCAKENTNPGNDTDNPVTGNIDQKFVGKWMWTQSGDGAYYGNDGVYHGPTHGMAQQYNINSDGTGTAYSHIYSVIGSVGLEVNISYKGFYESDDAGHLGFFPTSGTYTSSSSGTRALRADELYDTKKNTGKTFLFQKVVVTTQGGRACFQTTSSYGVVDTYYKMN